MRRFTFGALPLRGKMTIAALTPLMFILLLVALAAAWLINAWVVGETQQQVRNDLTAAREVFSHEGSRIADAVRFTAHTSLVVQALERGEGTFAAEKLRRMRVREGLDLLTLVDVEGRVLLRAAAGTEPLREPSILPFVPAVLAGDPFAGTVLLDPAELQRENPDLAEAARIFTPAGRLVEERGMLLVGASPVLGPDGEVVGGLYGGVLVNNNLALIDRIREIIYGTGSGSATIFLDRVRIATTILLPSGARAIGTLVSDEVAEAVLEKGRTWLARARVVNDWYLTAYEPVRNPADQTIGALYVGLLEAPFSSLKKRAVLILLGILAIGCSTGYLLAHYVARRIARPIVELEDSARRLAEGERNVPLPATDEDEVGQLTRSFESMTVALRKNEEELNELNRVLEAKVTERTAELEAKSLELMQTQQELLRSEKLAAIGELAAGVAHEINNPAAIIRGNVELLTAQLPPEHPAREEADEILKQTERVSRITQNMLTFARDQSIRSEPVRVNDLVAEVLDQVGHHEPVQKVEISTEFDKELPAVRGDGERLRQVFTNVVVNALQAMDGVGVLRIVSRIEGNAIEVRFEDSGPGILEEHQEKIFNPFFTTRSTGAGLGLSVSYGIVKALGGSIRVRSKPGSGTTFHIYLPIG